MDSALKQFISMATVWKPLLTNAELIQSHTMRGILG